MTLKKLIFNETSTILRQRKKHLKFKQKFLPSKMNQRSRIFHQDFLQNVTPVTTVQTDRRFVIQEVTETGQAIQPVGNDRALQQPTFRTYRAPIQNKTQKNYT